MKLRHFYHLYCGQFWREVASSHIQALQDSGADWDVTAGIVGPDDVRADALSLFRRALPETGFIEAAKGWEQVTLHALHDWAQTARPDEPVLYAHSKGVTHQGGAGTAAQGLPGRVWRESMTRLLVSDWRRCVELLGDHDAVGCHWATPQAYPGFVEDAMFAGNFWWTRAGYARRLPVLSDETRHHAEGWVGLGNPVVVDLRPGWPNPSLFSREILAELNPGSQIEVFRPAEVAA